MATQPNPERRLETFERDGVFDRSWEAGEQQLDEAATAALKAEFEAMKQAVADRSATVREPFDPSA